MYTTPTINSNTKRLGCKIAVDNGTKFIDSGVRGSGVVDGKRSISLQLQSVFEFLIFIIFSIAVYCSSNANAVKPPLDLIL